MKIKRLLFDIMEDILSPIREKRKYYEKRIPEVIDILKKGTEEANIYANDTLEKVKEAIGINYFNDDNFLEEQIKKYEN